MTGFTKRESELKDGSAGGENAGEDSELEDEDERLDKKKLADMEG
jgi:hypothetical protein